MALFNQVVKKVKMNSWDIVKFQIMTYCYLEKVIVSESDLECLTFLAIQGEQELTSFCNECASRKIFSSPQTVRNAITKAEKKGLIDKTSSKTKKKIQLNPVMKVTTEGNIMLDFKFAAIAETQEA